MRKRIARRLMWVIWSGFLAAALAEMIVFAMFDPLDLHLFAVPFQPSRTAIYTLGFMFFWALGAGASALALFLEHAPSTDAARGHEGTGVAPYPDTHARPPHDAG